MATHKLKILIPDRAELLEGLDPRSVHPPLARAVAAAAAAKKAHSDARAEMARLERLLDGLPERIRRGEAPASSLEPLMRQRDAAALLVPEAARSLAAARARVPNETAAAWAALAAEVAARRKRHLQRAADEMRDVLAELAELDKALVATLGRASERAYDPARRGIGAAGPRLSWPSSPEDLFLQRRSRGVVAGANRVITREREAAAQAEATSGADARSTGDMLMTRPRR